MPDEEGTTSPEEIPCGKVGDARENIRIISNPISVWAWLEFYIQL